MGVSEHDFWHLTMRTLNAYIKADEIKKRQKDYENWLLGAYIKNAVSVAIENNFAKKPKAKYVEKPFFEQAEEQKKQEQLTEKEKIEQTKQFFMRLKIMQSNFNLNKEKKGNA